MSALFQKSVKIEDVKNVVTAIEREVEFVKV